MSGSGKEKGKRMTIYYVDYENVNSQGLKGVEHLTENDEVNILYSKKADNVKIDILTALMASKASIRFIPVHVGTPNALDFQLITLLFLHYTKENRYFIISKDCGYDCCIKTALELGADTIARCENIEISLAAPSEYRSRRRSRRRGQDSAYADFTGRSFQNPQQQASSAPDNPRTEPVIPGSSQSAADQWIRTAMPGGAMQLVRNEEELNSYSSEPLPPSVAALASAYSQQEDMQNTADSSESAAGELPSENLREAFAEGPLSAFPEDAAAEMNLQAASEEKTPDELPQEQISEKNTGFAVSEESAGFAAPEESAGFAAPEESAGFTALTEDSADSAPAEEKTDFISAESGTAITPAEEKEGFAAFSEDSLPEKLPGSDFIIDAPAEDDFASAMPMPTFSPDLTEEEAEIFPEDSTASAQASDSGNTEGRSGRRSRRGRQNRKQAADSSQSQQNQKSERQNNAQNRQNQKSERNNSGQGRQNQKADRQDNSQGRQNQKTDRQDNSQGRQNQKAQKQTGSQNQQNQKADNKNPVGAVSDIIRKKSDVALTQEQAELVLASIRNSATKQQFYNYFAKKLGQKNGLELYHSIKSSYNDLIAAGLKE